MHTDFSLEGSSVEKVLSLLANNSIIRIVYLGVGSV